MHPIVLRGARTHHLKGVDLELRPGELVCVTGISGSGKSSLAFDTLYSEGQRRFVESFSPYARQYLERLERPPMGGLDPVAAAVAVDRRAPIKSSRSTLATMADLEAYLSALFARAAVPQCESCGVEAVRLDPLSAAVRAVGEHGGARAVVSYAVAVAGAEQLLDVRESLLRDGYRRLFVRGESQDIDAVRPSDVSGGVVDVVVDRVSLEVRGERRLSSAIEEAWGRADGRATLHVFREGTDAPRRVPAVRGLCCPRCGRGFAAPRPGMFSYESPVGACESCRGFGRVLGIDWSKVVPDESKSLAGGAIRPWSGPKAGWERRTLRKFCDRVGIDMDRPWAELEDTARRRVLEGEGSWHHTKYPGVATWFRWLESKAYKMHVRVLLSRYRSYDPCPACRGKRLGPAALQYRVAGLDLGDWHALELGDARARLLRLAFDGQAEMARTELVARLGYLERVGLGYLSLDRQARTLSGGEAQRVALTAALGTSLTGALFVLDEPTVGLHPADVAPLVTCMRELAAGGNAVVVVEHDATVIRAADRVVDLGPGAGPCGGQIVFDGPPLALASRADLATGRALGAGRRSASLVATPTSTRDDSRGWLRVVEASANNLRDVSVALPLGAVVAVCGPSGSGKSSLVDDVLYRTLARARGYQDVELPGAHRRIEGASSILAVTLVDQSPLGRTSRGNAATYTGAWTRLRALFAARPEAVVRGFGPAHFSFNVAAGRCEACAGEGAETVEMQFLADVRLECPSCRGRRFRDDVLEVRLDGRNVADVLAMTVGEALEAFELERAVRGALAPLGRLGLGYLPLGQPLSTLSGGEAQRLKLARALGEKVGGQLFILDEPSAGLHAEEVALLAGALRELVAGGGSVVLVDHDLDLVAGADWVVELGPGAGREGGRVVFEGPPADLRAASTRTGEALRPAAAAPVARRRSMRSHAERPADGPRAIEVRGAREHNLRSVDVDVPHGKLVVVTGPSGSGKSTLAFDVIFAEGQRRFLETLSPYARQFLPMLPRPAVDSVSNVPPSIALEQRTARAGAASTVATVTEIAHYLRLLFAKLGEAHCPDCDLPVRPGTVDDLLGRLRKRGRGALLAPVVRGRKGSYLEVFDAAARAGLRSAVVDGVRVDTDVPPRLAKRSEHSIDLVIYEGDMRELPRPALQQALTLAQGHAAFVEALPGASPAGARRRKGKAPDAVGDGGALQPELFSTARACQRCGRAIPELDPRWFSFNTKQGRCPGCEGTGVEGGAEALAAALEAGDPEPEACQACAGSRLSAVPRAVRLFGERYHEHAARSVSAMLRAVDGMRFDGDRARVAEAPLAELRRRVAFVHEVGLGYLGLDRRADSLSGGEMQRLRLAAQLGAGLTGALYVLDEPTVGLHPRDTQRLLSNLRALVSTGSTVLVVEHDADTIRAADLLLDLGPAGGRAGGHLIASGPPADVLANPASPTGRALADEHSIARARPRMPPPESWLVVRGVAAHNLRIDEVRFPAGRMCVVAGVSGSGKSTLVRQVLHPAVARALLRRKGGRATTGAHAPDALDLPASVQRVLGVDQSPIGRTPRSVPATFLGVWDEIRKLFAASPEARARGYRATRFSFNSSAGGRCEVCGGNGLIAHEMAFLPDVKTLCDACGGSRFEPQTLDVHYLGLTIGDVLHLTVEEALVCFAAHRKIARPLATLCDLGLGYVELGQASPTLSGGEAQRLKLAAELTAGGAHKPTLYVLDEPTTGLHHSDVARLVAVLDALVQRGDSLIVIEHHPAVIAAADHIIELGPEGGEAGGRVVASGTPEVVSRARTATGLVLRRMLATAAAVVPSRAGGTAYP